MKVGRNNNEITDKKKTENPYPYKNDNPNMMTNSKDSTLVGINFYSLFLLSRPRKKEM